MAMELTGWWRRGRVRTVPFGRFFLYYIALVAVAVALVTYVPAVRQAFLAPLILPTKDAQEQFYLGAATNTNPSVQPPPREGGNEILERTVTTALTILGALALILPVAWVYMFTRRLRYDPSLAQTVIMLPPVVAGIVVVVKNSLALAFSLAGIVAAVRFRNTLKDPKDAVFVFLTLGIGLAAGVQALDIALVMSLVFNVMILLLWKYNLAAIYSGVSTRQAALSVGDSRLLRVRETKHSESERELVSEGEVPFDPDGVILVHTSVPEAARRGLEISLERRAKKWCFLEGPQPGKGIATLRVAVKLRKKTDPASLLGELDDRWAPYIAASEYVAVRLQDDEDD